MDSVTKLQNKLREAENILRYVSKELEGFAKDKSVGSKLNFTEIKLRGEQYAFYEHPLKKQIFQDEYFALMIYIISLGGKKEEGWTLLYRIAAGCDYQKDLQHLTTDAMTLTEERLSEIIRMIHSAEMSRTFALDSLMICCHMGADDAQLKFLSNLYDLMKLDKNFLTEAIHFVKAFNATFLENLAEKIGAWKSLTAKEILPYIAYPAASLEEAAKLKYERVAVSNITYTGKDVLNLDKWKADAILFVDCRFENCGGVASNDKVVKFAGCTFDGNIKRWTKINSWDRDYRWIDKQYSAYRGFLHFNDAEFIACSFQKFSDGIPMMYLNGGSIHLCTFEGCVQSCGSSMLIYVNNTHVTANKFTACKNQLISDAANQSCQTCMIYSANSKWRQNTFSDCQSHFCEVTRESSFNCLILLDKNSDCTDCSFERSYVMATTYSTDYGRIPAYVIGLRDSKQSNNTVGEITSRYAVPVGEIKDISRDVFIVGDKHYDP